MNQYISWRSAAAFCLLLLAGCRATTETGSGGDQPGVPRMEQPLIELAYESRMIKGLPRTCIYRDGKVRDIQYGTTNVYMLRPARVRDIVQALEQNGFFGLDEDAIRSKVEKADANWNGENVRHVMTMVDATTTVLAVNLPPRVNRISVTGLDAHMKAYPSIGDFRVFKRCIEVVADFLQRQPPQSSKSER